MSHTIRDVAQFSTLLKKRGSDCWKLELPELTPVENNAAERTIRMLRQVCGCSQGAAVMFLSLGGYVAILVWGDVHESDRIFLEIVVGILILIGSVGIGKTVALLLARRKLKIFLREMRRLVDSSRC